MKGSTQLQAVSLRSFSFARDSRGTPVAATTGG